MQIKRTLLSAVLVVQALWPQAPIEQPQIGLYRDSRGALRRLLGVTGAFTAGDALQEHVQGAEFFQQQGLVWADGQVSLLNADGTPLATVAAPAAQLLFAAEPDNASVRVVDAETGRTWLLTGQGLTDSLLVLPPHSLAVAVHSEGAVLFAAQNQDQLCVYRTTARWAQPVTEHCTDARATSARLLSDGTLVWTTDNSVSVRKPDGEAVHRELAKRTWQLRHVSANWLLLAGSQQLYLLRPSTTDLFELPAEPDPAQRNEPKPGSPQEDPSQENQQ